MEGGAGITKKKENPALKEHWIKESAERQMNKQLQYDIISPRVIYAVRYKGKKKVWKGNWRMWDFPKGQHLNWGLKEE